MNFTSNERKMAEDWAGILTNIEAGVSAPFLGPNGLPFSFVYGGQKSADLIPGWTSKTVQSKDHETLHTTVYSDPNTGLQVSVEATVFSDFPAVEWLMRLKNTGSADTGIIEDIRPIDAIIQSPDTNPVLHYAKGSVCSIDDYKPLTRIVNKGAEASFRPGGGRSSSEILPFFNIETNGGKGVILAVGWSGEWRTEFLRNTSDDLNIRAGMDLTHLKLHPGEEIRTPRILTLFWEGDRARSQNMLRRFILAHHRPMVNGEPLDTPLFAANWGGTPASDHLENIEAIIEHEVPIDIYWIDANWFGDYVFVAGSWQAKADLYPDGLKPISDALHKSGRKLLLWFEPERVNPGTVWFAEHPEWLLSVPKDKAKHNWQTPMEEPEWVEWESKRNQIGGDSKLFNLGNAEARQFMTDFISAKIDEFGLDCYRHDANIAPVDFWREADDPDRQGMSEIKWVEGLYEFWEELLRRHPGLMIDNCASGGRRIDIETLSLATPFWRTDYPNTCTAKQCHTFGLMPWVPLSSTGNLEMWNCGDYDLRSTMSSSLVLGLSEVNPETWRVPPIPPDYPWEKVNGMLHQYRSIQKFFLGDYYPLTEYSQAEDAWMVYQLDLPEQGEGLVVAMKRPLSQLTAGSFALQGVDENAQYEVRYMDKDEIETMSGTALRNGLGIELTQRPASALIMYRRVS